ncbi:M48 family metallopeptidase [Peribacillus sp. B-H-3]|uniref:M48 family metallopeptidase n=1 Tax=Peribacillus sp. B-H-3 TaxID=3400420 RepID=UPI003B011203
MARKWAAAAVGVYLISAAFMYWYLFYGGSGAIPSGLKGTAADPATFLNGRELLLSEQYSKIRNFIFFLSTPYEWLFYFLVLISGLSRVFERWAISSSKWKALQTAVYLFWLSLLSFAVSFPFDYVSYAYSKRYNISTQSFSSWMKDNIIDFWVSFGTMFILAGVIYWLMKKSAKKWWLYAWLLSIPFSLFMMFVQPVIIDPLYNDFYPLKDKNLETKILAMAQKAHIPTDHVYEVNMAKKTNSLNAYVTGIGSNSRIVLWDTTLKKLNDKEIMFIMAHEMGHYVEKHIYYGIAGYLVLTFAGLWLIAKLMDFMVRKRGKLLQLSDVSSLRSLPLFLLLAGVLLFASSPLTNYASRYQETRADQYAMKMTHDKNSAVKTFQELTRAGLSEVNPPLLVKWFRYTHPAMLDRITTASQYKK